MTQPPPAGADGPAVPVPIAFGGGRLALAVTAGQDPSAVLAALGLGDCGRRPVVVVCGGAADLDPGAIRRAAGIIGPALACAAERVTATVGSAPACQPAVIDGGTDAGVMAALGSARGQRAGSLPILLGVAPLRKVTWPGGPEGDRTRLEPNHTHFVLADTPEWGGETGLLLDVATELARGPVVMVLAGGGPVAQQEVLGAVRRGWPVFVIGDTGGLAQRIATREHKGRDLDEILRTGDIRVFEGDDPRQLGLQISRELQDEPTLNGRIPLTFRIGLAGRRASGRGALAPAVTEAIVGLNERLLGPRGQPARLVISMLADGAERPVTKTLVASPNARLDAVLRQQAASCMSYFAVVSPGRDIAGANRTADHERAGRDLVDRSDAIIALWGDKEPERGQDRTAMIVRYARETKVPLARVSVARPSAPAAYELAEPRRSDFRTVVREFRTFNAPRIGGFPDQFRAACQSLEPARSDAESETFRRMREQAAGWAVPYFVRADVLASRLGRWFKATSAAVFVLAAAAVVVIAAQVNFASGHPLIVLGEAALLLLLLGVTLTARRRRVLDRWISYRFLAERLRSAYFLALAGPGERASRAGPTYLSDPSEAWIKRALTEMTQYRPRLEAGEADVDSLRGYLRASWIRDQIRYHDRAARREGRWEVRLFMVTGILFALTLLAAVLHVLEVGADNAQAFAWGKVIIVLSICLPAAGAAVHGIRTQAQFRRQSQRYARMADVLRKLERDMCDARTLPQIRAVAVDTEKVMLEENSDWFGVMRFHDVELIT